LRHFLCCIFHDLSAAADLPNVETHSCCPQAFLSLDFHLDFRRFRIEKS